jgi:hypothetical protein
MPMSVTPSTPSLSPLPALDSVHPLRRTQTFWVHVHWKLMRAEMAAFSPLLFWLPLPPWLPLRLNFRFLLRLWVDRPFGPQKLVLCEHGSSAWLRVAVFTPQPFLLTPAYFPTTKPPYRNQNSNLLWQKALLVLPGVLLSSPWCSFAEHVCGRRADSITHASKASLQLFLSMSWVRPSNRLVPVATGQGNLLHWGRSASVLLNFV